MDYLSSADSNANGLIEQLSGGVARIKVDSTSIPDDAARGRKSVRLESNTVYNHGLFIADVAHMPSSTCGLWPALQVHRFLPSNKRLLTRASWQVGPNWFRDGEVDIVEGVHEATTNLISLHTDGTEGVCTLIPNEENGLVGSTQCDNAITSAGGCGVSSGPFGTPFNDRGGGVYAMEWLSSGIKVWFFGRDEIPEDITTETPNPSRWSAPVLQVGSNCDVDAHFRNMRIVIDTTFCGDWAGNPAVWQQTSCYKANPISSNTCIDYVKNHPEAYADGYWDIKSIKVYKQKTVPVSKPEPLEAEPDTETEPTIEPPNGAPTEIPSKEPAIEEVPPIESSTPSRGELQTEEPLVEDFPTEQDPPKGETSASDPSGEEIITAEPSPKAQPSSLQSGSGLCGADYSHSGGSEVSQRHTCHRCNNAKGPASVSEEGVSVGYPVEATQASDSAELLQTGEGVSATKLIASYIQVRTESPESQYIQASPGGRNKVAETLMVAIIGGLFVVSLISMF